MRRLYVGRTGDEILDAPMDATANDGSIAAAGSADVAGAAVGSIAALEALDEQACSTTRRVARPTGTGTT